MVIYYGVIKNDTHNVSVFNVYKALNHYMQGWYPLINKYKVPRKTRGTPCSRYYWY